MLINAQNSKNQIIQIALLNIMDVENRDAEGLIKDTVEYALFQKLFHSDNMVWTLTTFFRQISINDVLN